MLLNKVLQNLHPHVWVVDLKTKTNCFNTGVYIQSSNWEAALCEKNKTISHSYALFSETISSTSCFNLKPSHHLSSASYRFDPVADAHDQLPILLHLVDKLHWQHATVKRLAELFRRCVQSSSKTVPLGFTNKSWFSVELYCQFQPFQNQNVAREARKRRWRNGDNQQQLLYRYFSLWCFKRC